MTLAAIVTAALEGQFVEEKSFSVGGERTHCWASQWKPCARAMALDLMHPEDRGEVDAEGCARMTWGDVFESEVRIKLERAGRRSDPAFTVEGAQQHFKLRDRSDRVIITGKVDGRLNFSDGRRPVFEMKRGKSYERCRTVEDLLAGAWSASAVYQILSYLLGNGEPMGLMIIDTGAIPRVIEVELESYLGLAENFLVSAEVAVDCKLEGSPLPGFSDNPEHCRRCDHRGKSCAPPWFAEEGPYISTWPELAELVAIADDDEKAQAAKDHNKARSRLRDLTRGKPLVIIGDRTITGRQVGNGWRMTIEKG